MAGIKANSASVTMLDGDTAVDNTFAGYATTEQITLTVTDAAPTTLVWALAAPLNSVYAQLKVDEDNDLATLVPDVQGFWTATAVVDGGTTYVLRMSVSQFGVVTMREALELPPVDPANISAPALGRVLFSDLTNSSHLSVKLPDNSVVDLEV